LLGEGEIYETPGEYASDAATEPGKCSGMSPKRWRDTSEPILGGEVLTRYWITKALAPSHPKGRTFLSDRAAWLETAPERLPVPVNFEVIPRT